MKNQILFTLFSALFLLASCQKNKTAGVMVSNPETFVIERNEAGKVSIHMNGEESNFQFDDYEFHGAITETSRMWTSDCKEWMHENAIKQIVNIDANKKMSFRQTSAGYAMFNDTSFIKFDYRCGSFDSVGISNYSYFIMKKIVNDTSIRYGLYSRGKELIPCVCTSITTDKVIEATMPSGTVMVYSDSLSYIGATKEKVQRFFGGYLIKKEDLYSYFNFAGQEIISFDQLVKLKDKKTAEDNKILGFMKGGRVGCIFTDWGNDIVYLFNELHSSYLYEGARNIGNRTLYKVRNDNSPSYFVDADGVPCIVGENLKNGFYFPNSFWFKKQDGWMVYSQDTALLIQTSIYSETKIVGDYDQHILFVKSKERKWGCIDQYGRQLAAPLYNSIELKNNEIVAVNDKVTYYFDSSNGKLITTKID